MIVGLPGQIKKIPDPSMLLFTNPSTPAFTSYTPVVRNLGVTLDPRLSFSNHISNLSRFCFMARLLSPLHP